MRHRIILGALTGAAALLTACSTHSGSASRPEAHSPTVSVSRALAYPDSQKVNQVDTLHGVEIQDPYRWLEEADVEATSAWVEAQNKVTFDYLGSIEERGAINERLTELWDYERYGSPFKEGGRYFFSKNDGLQNQSVLYTVDSLGGQARVLLDPNKLSKDGTMALSATSVSPDGKLLAYAVSDGGSDWVEIRVRDIDTGRDLPDVVKWVKFSNPSWTKDGKGFFYSRYDEPTDGHVLGAANYFQKLYYHRVGTPQSQDELIYQDTENKEWGFGGGVTDDGQYLIIRVWKGTARQNLVYYKDLTSSGSEVVKLIDTFEASYSFIDNDGPVFWFRTDLDAPRGRVIAIDTRRPDRAQWKEVIPQGKDTLRGVSAVGGRFAASYLVDAQSQVRIYGLDGAPVGKVELPGIGSVGGFGGKRNDPETFYTFTSFTSPAAVYRYDMSTGKSTLFRAPDVDFDPADYTTKQVFYRSKDGTRIPMFITHKKGLRLNGQNPTYLYGYGGFDVAITPSFSVANLVWMEMGGVFAVANLRGGGEYGKEWHNAGKLLNKQNVFDDFISAAEWLITNRYTSTPKLAIAGGSNGGLLVGACMTQRPDLFGACLPAVGVMDMLRFHKFTIGWAWVSDYGSPDEEEHFKNLLAYSPLHNLKPGTCYPPTMVTTADRDDRVVPAHSFKFAAALQAAQACDNPVLIRIETRAGHGAGKPTTKQIEEAADRWAFLVETLGMKSN